MSDAPPIGPLRIAGAAPAAAAAAPVATAGRELFVRIEGFADRETVAQAAANAAR